MKEKNDFWKKYEKDIRNLKSLCENIKSIQNLGVGLFDDLLNLIDISIERDSKYKEILKQIEMFEASNNFLVLPPSVKRFSFYLDFHYLSF